MSPMAVEVKKLDVKIGDVVEIDRRRYDVVSDKAGGVALEPAITKSVEELAAQRGGRSLSREEFDELFGDLPRDGEG
jgi:bifunctional DNA-binding transcriptional regulator/antitoxin component of YhaV-PrlF toxin-antitoxin module